MATIKAHNVNIVGSGEQHLVLAPGFGTDQSFWRYLVPHLMDDYRVILFDQMGGGTTNPDYYDFDRYSTLDGHALDVLAILEELGIESCIYVGHSVSGAVGAIASVYRPHRFQKLVMLGASPRYLNDVDYYGGFDQEDIDQLFEAMRVNYITWCSGFAPLMVGGDLNSVALQEYSRTLFNIRPDIALSLITTIFQSDIRHLLGHITVPCHIIQSRNDPAVPLVVSDYLYRNLGGESVVELIESEGHIPHLSSPGVAIPAILRHIRLSMTS
ncbi:hypothetical protein M9H77_32401 [Catharanthus roseus]|uniref:Uncharacterized protein n=1 Tax=Catharanthus roseus TaxID=4058 RepID=A0ACC0A4U6_CATRO|nr:hypothetical protein M9H77_32401 [Catharanthus roseus]